MITKENGTIDETVHIPQPDSEVLEQQPEAKRFKLLVGDKRLWIIVMLLMIISALEVFSASSRFFFGKENFINKDVILHFVFMLVGFIAMVIVHRIPCRFYKAFTYPFLALSAVLLIILFARGIGDADAQRWIEILGFNFQPSELAKMAVLLYTASVASAINKEDENSQKEGFWKILICMGIFCFLIVGENLSTAFLLCVTVILMMLICGVSPKRTWKLIGAGAAFVAVVLAFFLLVPATKMNTLAEQNLVPGRATTWQARVLDFFDEKQTAKEYALTTAKDKPQETHAKIAIATSGLVWGKGIGNSEERDYIQEATCDFIYAIIIEECGMLISIAVLGLYIWMMYICGTIISKPITPFTSYLVVGIAILLGLQAMINMMVAVGAMPVTGQPLPLISKGGTSMPFSSIYFGFLIGISRSIGQENKDELVENVKATE